MEKNWLSGSQAESIKYGSALVCSRPLFNEKMENYLNCSTKTPRLDQFWMEVVPCQQEFAELRVFLKMVLNLSHGNAFAENEFSINAELIINSLPEDSIIAQRQVYDAIMYYDGIVNID